MLFGVIAVCGEALGDSETPGSGDLIKVVEMYGWRLVTAAIRRSC
jgi:hypothetical protein